MNFEGRVAVITGGGSGIGRAVAERWAARGGQAVIVDFDPAAGERVRDGIVAGGHLASFVQCDLRDLAQVDGAIARVDAEHGRLDMLLNNGFAPWNGEDSRAYLGEVSQGHWDHVLHLGITSPFRMTKAALSLMQRSGGGAIINTASMAALAAQPTVGPYSVAKAALAHFTRLIAVEYASANIRCNAVCPGIIETPLVVAAALDQSVIDQIPMKRLERPEEVADVILFLASDLASYVTGAVMSVDGGIIL